MAVEVAMGELGLKNKSDAQIEIIQEPRGRIDDQLQRIAHAATMDLIVDREQDPEHR